MREQPDIRVRLRADSGPFIRAVRSTTVVLARIVQADPAVSPRQRQHATVLLRSLRRSASNGGRNSHWRRSR